MDLLEGGLDGEPALDVALADALLRMVAAGRRAPVLRVYVPAPTVAFGRRDVLEPGFPAAAQAAHRHGFTPVIRSAGGRAAAYDEGSLVLEEVMTAEDSATGIQQRFAAEAERQASVLRRLGVDARVGEVPGEYCPGEFSVNARGATKLIGAAQRIIPGGWLFATVVVVRASPRLRVVLEDVYAALDLGWDRRTVGAIADEVSSVTVEEVKRTLLGMYAERYRLVSATVTAQERAAATARLERHRVDVRPGGRG